MKWFVSFQARPIYYRKDGSRRLGDLGDYFAVWDMHPSLYVAKQRREQNKLDMTPPTDDRDTQHDDIKRIYMAIPMEGTHMPKALLEWIT
jgi:hypothetical protein